MALDSALKRRSSASVAGVPWIPGVTPNAAKPAAWRQQAGWSYSGAAPAPPAFDGPICGTLAVEPVVNGTLSIEDC